MFERTKARALPVVNQASDSTPVAVACCNACRVCVTTNLVGLALAGVTAGAAATVAFGRRVAKRA